MTRQRAPPLKLLTVIGFGDGESKEENMPTETVATAELPEKVYILVMYYEQLDMAGPVFIPFDDIGFACPVFGERELAENFSLPPTSTGPQSSRRSLWSTLSPPVSTQ